MGKANRSEYSFIQAGPLRFAAVEIVRTFPDSGNAIGILREIVNADGTHYPKGSRVILLRGEW